MHWRSDDDLPARFAGRIPPVATEVIVAISMIALAIGFRLGIDVFFKDVVPFALIFPAIVVATLLAGTRSGILTLVGCQIVVWYFLLPVQRSFAFETSANFVSLLLTTVAEALLLWFVSSYRNAVRETARLEKKRLAAKDFALRELDHRTKNNFQIAGALLHLHASRSSLPEIRDELEAAARRLISIASIHEHLSIAPSAFSCVPLREYLEDICNRVRAGLADEGIVIAADIAPLEVSHELALHLGLIVNELVTNALKHAFAGKGGWINVMLRQENEELLLRVSDNGVGLSMETAAPDTAGIGTKLVDMLAQAIEGSIARTGETGMIVEVRVPVGANGDHSMAAALYGKRASKTQFPVSGQEQVT
jgi:two-component sensor histidine kinase